MIENYLNFLIPQTVAEKKSLINGKVKVVKFASKTRIMVGGLIQSGGMVEVIWKKALKAINYYSLTIDHCLILGLGGGTVANLINQSFPKAKITGVEIDPLMIALGKKYFNLNKISGLKIIQQDAVKLITNYQLPITNYQLIIVDMYLGNKVPFQSESDKFLKNLKKIISKKGIIIFNRLFYGQHKKETEKFINKLAKFFLKTKLIRAYSNLLVFASK